MGMDLASRRAAQKIRSSEINFSVLLFSSRLFLNKTHVLRDMRTSCLINRRYKIIRNYYLVSHVDTLFSRLLEIATSIENEIFSLIRSSNTRSELFNDSRERRSLRRAGIKVSLFQGGDTGRGCRKWGGLPISRLRE